MIRRGFSTAHPNIERMQTLFTDRLTTIKQEGRYRIFTDIGRISGWYPRGQLYTKQGPRQKEIISFCSNDYLSMGQHPVVLSAMRKVLNANGAGAGGTRNISGTSPYHSELESELSDLHRTDRALVFSSGFVANDSTIATLGRMLPGCVIFSDECNHASLIDGIRNSGCEKQIYRHNDVEHLESLLSKKDPTSPAIIVFESVYSMSGDISPIEAICTLASAHGAMTLVDEVHAVGLYGQTGAGMTEYVNPAHRPTIISGTLSKGYGVYGGYIASTDTICDVVRSAASGFIFTTALPPAIAAGAIASIQHLKHSSIERTTLHRKVHLLKALLTIAGIPFMDTDTHIVPILIGNPVLSKRISTLLLERYGLYIQHINYPTVARGTERLRLTPGPTHTDQMLEQLVRSISSVFRMVGIKCTPYI